MTDLRCLLANLRRPRLLIRAARFGIDEYRRDRDLRRLINGIMPTEAALPRLAEVEEEMEERRRAGNATYSVTRHVEVLIALMAEMRLLPHRLDA